MRPTSTSGTCKRDIENDVYMLYDSDDSSMVEPIKNYLQRFYTLFDPLMDGPPSTYLCVTISRNYYILAPGIPCLVHARKVLSQISRSSPHRLIMDDTFR
jgi:hypothetical protein